MKLTNKSFIERSENIHKDSVGIPLYDYSEIDLKGALNKIKIKCKRCGNIFEQTPNKHLLGHGCRRCNLKNSSTSNNDDFIAKSKLVHNDDYDYSLVKYDNCKSKVLIKCKKCGLIFKQSPSSHLSGSGCPNCANESRYRIRKSTEDFIKQSIEIHRDIHDNPLFDYSKSIFKGSRSNIILICKKCGKEFEQRTSHHLNGSGCPYCKKSEGEKKLEKLLYSNDITYIPEYKFKNCVNKKSLPFDFYLPDYNICIEFDGIHHFEERSGMGGYNRFVIQQKNDRIKNEFCINNNIKLFRIKYSDNINLKFKDIIDYINNIQL